MTKNRDCRELIQHREDSEVRLSGMQPQVAQLNLSVVGSQLVDDYYTSISSFLSDLTRKLVYKQFLTSS